jgi:hypothetical protein
MPKKTARSVAVVANSRDSIHLLNAKEPSVPNGTPARASSICFHCDSSTTSPFRPLFVSP